MNTVANRGAGGRFVRPSDNRPNRDRSPEDLQKQTDFLTRVNSHRPAVIRPAEPICNGCLRRTVSGFMPLPGCPDCLALAADPGAALETLCASGEVDMYQVFALIKGGNARNDDDWELIGESKLRSRSVGIAHESGRVCILKLGGACVWMSNDVCWD